MQAHLVGTNPQMHFTQVKHSLQTDCLMPPYADVFQAPGRIKDVTFFYLFIFSAVAEITTSLLCWP